MSWPSRCDGRNVGSSLDASAVRGAAFPFVPVDAALHRKEA